MNKGYCENCNDLVDYETKEEKRTSEIRGKNYNYKAIVGICKKCGEVISSNEILDENLERLDNAFREKEHIITTEEINQILIKYKIGKKPLSKLLGWGEVTLIRFLNGDVPTKAYSDQLYNILNDVDYMSKVLEKNKHLISARAYVNVKNAIDEIRKTSFMKVSEETEEYEYKDIFQAAIKKHLNNYLNRNPDIYNGYKELDIEKLENIISYVASKVKKLTVTSLNKYLWFIDMLYFNQETIAVTGLTYQKQKFGPTIIDKKCDELTMLDDKFLGEFIETKDGNITKIIVSKGNYDLSCINDKEKEIIDMVIKLLKNKTVSEISELSRKEDGWKKTKMYERISFEHAMNLKFNK